MVEQDTIDGKEAMSVPVIPNHPIGVYLCCAIRATRAKRSFFILRGRGVSEHLTRRSLVEACFDSAPPNGFEHPRRAEPRNVSGELRHVKADPNMALSAKVVNFVRFHIVNKVAQLPPVIQVPVMQEKLVLGIMGIRVDMINSICIKGT